MPKKLKYMLIDGNALIHRAFHAIPNLTNKKGEPTGAVYGFITTLLKAMKDIKPTHIACTFDLEGPTFRHERYKEYKATRVKAPQELYDQIPSVKEVVKALNVPIFEKKGFEADDILGTLSVHTHREHPEAEVIIVTGDLDTLQLVNHQIKVYTLRKGLTDTAIYDEKAVRARYGLNPDQMVDFKALRGDPSDNIPGVSGIGEKTAAELIKDFKSLDGLYKAIKQEKTGKKIKPRILELLEAQEKEARESFELSKIVCNAPIETEIKEYEFGDANRQQVFEVFSELEFKSLLNKLPSTPTHPLAPARGRSEEGGQEKDDKDEHPSASNIGKLDYVLVKDEAHLSKIIKELSSAEEISIDTETTSVRAEDAELVGVGLAVKKGKAYYVPADLALASDELKKLLSNHRIKKIGHNIKYDYEVLSKQYTVLSGVSFDTMVASYLLNAGTRQHNLDALAFSEFGYQMQPIEELIGRGKSLISMDQVEPKKVSWYCCEDVDMTLRLKQVFEPQLRAEKLEKIFREVEMPLVEVLAQMEMAGIKLNTKVLDKLAGETEVDLKELESQIHKSTHSKVNINSPKQLKELLFEKLKLPPPEGARKTKTGFSTAAEELEKMKHLHPVIPKILEYRELSKLQNTYLLALPELVSKKTGRLHTSYNQTVTATGRLSSSDPNLQNIPVRGEGLGGKTRQAFVAERGYRLLSLDYSQIELRLVAHLAQDKDMLEVFKKGEDIHEKTAMEIFGVLSSAVTKDMRRDAKTINFGILYGLSSFGLSSRIGEISRAEAKEFIEKYFKAYPAVEDYIEQIKLQVNEEGFVRNELGRVRKFPEIKSSQWQLRAAAERAAVNFPIQSLAADVIKVAMINIHKETSKQYPVNSTQKEIQMLLQVHDELVFEVEEDKVEHWAKKLARTMEEAIKLSVPIKVEAKAGDNWGELESLNI